ncbi:methyltransferase [Curtobacterium flaccumfaciens]|uniref:methyltransferase n=1 Tax=Curtobacterium flaccumfaciens TaxID=2035 RepID=UPI001BDEC502|nr:methyltransferase [Curtobacterium flaccumfaciens]MBT1672837.1 methyltransferase [Curtobacterium flaccumfaciens pv. flaccumfaciens]
MTEIMGQKESGGSLTTLDRFNLIVNAPALFNAIVAAQELGVYEQLATAGPQSLEELGSALRLPEHQLRVLLFAVATTGLITRDGFKYQLSEEARELFDPTNDGNWGRILRGWRDIYYPGFLHTTEAIRRGENVALEALEGGKSGTLYEKLAGSAQERVFHDSMAAFTLQSLDDMVNQPEWPTVRTALDVGGGDGTSAAALLRTYPDLRITVLDHESVTDLIPSHERLQVHSGDFTTEQWQEGFDAVLFSHVLEVFDESQIRELLKKAYGALRPGGQLFVYGYHAAANETEGYFSARLSLYLNVLATGTGMAYPSSDYRRWASQEGFVEVSTREPLAFEHGFTVARRPTL